MKPAAFAYSKPTRQEDVLDLLAADPDGSKILAGGQSLVPMMNFRLARPERLIDINAVPGLAGLRVEADRVHIGTLTRHVTLQQSSGRDPLGRLLQMAASLVGHLPIRTRGTFGGSLAHSDAASEWCLVASLLDAAITVRSVRGTRIISAADFFLSVFTTSMNADELLVDVSLPVLGPEHQAGFAEFARRAGDFAIVAVGTDLRIVDGRVEDARVCIGGVSETPFRSSAAERVLRDQIWPNSPADSALVLEAAAAAAEEVSPPSDSHGDALYRRDLVRALLPRAIAKGQPK